nr:uncharacterized protein LOC109433162 [Aedes albopictus]
MNYLLNEVSKRPCRRLPDGRYEVGLPLKNSIDQLGESETMALRRFVQVERRLIHNPNVYEQYRAFMADYHDQGHMVKTNQMPRNDVFLTKVHEIQFHTGQPTKRTVYSDIAKLYDPLGLLGPLIFAAKVKLQKLWHLEVDWDEALSTEETESWECFRNQIIQMGEISIPRCVLPYNSSNSIELHGFCDASDLGYGACAYIRSVDSNNDCSVLLLTSKSRIAPLKNAKLTTARLELCGALVLARLISNITQNLSITFSRITLWSDSTTALAWIRTDPSRLKTFVCNRVIDIQNLTHDMEWRYVNTLDNPADVLSRGLLPSKVKDCEQWWTGPPFLRETDTFWPNQPQNTPAEQLPETKNTTICLTVTDPPVQFRLFEIESEFRKMQRKMAWMLRFIDHVRKGQHKDHRYGELTVPELHQATVALTSIAQREAFPNDIQRLRSGKNRNKWHKPFPVKPGQLVIIREDNQPPMNWKLGRIEQVFPGLDGLVRVADVRSGCKLVRRPIAKLCLLPVDDNVVQPDDDLHEDENDSE